MLYPAHDLIRVACQRWSIVFIFTLIYCIIYYKQNRIYIYEHNPNVSIIHRKKYTKVYCIVLYNEYIVLSIHAPLYRLLDECHVSNSYKYSQIF